MASPGVHLSSIKDVVEKVVWGTKVVDVHTHLFPPSHGQLFSFGIDQLLTYHYLVAEFFMTAKSPSYDEFFALPIVDQATLVWQHLFIERSPISEATRGIATILQRLGLEEEVQRRDLQAIRDWFARQDLNDHTERVFQMAGVKYCVMTNIPYDQQEQHFFNQAFTSRFRSSVRVDAFLTAQRGDSSNTAWASLEQNLCENGLPVSLVGLQQLLKRWIKKIQPEYLMASTPHDFAVSDDPLSAFSVACDCGLRSVDMTVPGAFGHQSKCRAAELSPTLGATELLEKVIIPVAEETQLPIAIKIGAWRNVNPALRAGGDGLVTFDMANLATLLRKYPKVKFLATFLSYSNQHEAAVLANKFPNLHLYGCWWYCNNPSLIKAITSMRLEMLGFGFTAQHSDCRVLEQLIYKWDHSRKIIAEVLVEQYTRILETGWPVTEDDIGRDVQRIFGGGYEDFISRTS